VFLHAVGSFLTSVIVLVRLECCFFLPVVQDYSLLVCIALTDEINRLRLASNMSQLMNNLIIAFADVSFVPVCLV